MKTLLSMTVLLPMFASAAGLRDRVKADFPGFENQSVVHYAVDPMSEKPYLPDAYPDDGRAAAPVRIIAAKGEYEPGAFLLYGVKDVDHVDFVLSDLKSAEGATLPASKLDLKTVKVWVQSGNGWYSYFADEGTKLCPELLLNDEDLVRVDREKMYNYARLNEQDGKVHYYWLNEPKAFHNRAEDRYMTSFRLDDTFAAMKPNFRDAETHRGARIVRDEFKEFLLTVNVTKDIPAGLYKGSIQLKPSNTQTTLTSIPITVRVLDFELPQPCCYFDTEKPYKTWFCDYTSLEGILLQNGNDPELARRQLVNIVADFARHGQSIPSFRGAFKMRDVVEEGGQEWSPDVGIGRGAIVSDPAVVRADARELRRFADRVYGKDAKVPVSWGDEYGLAILKGIRPSIDEYLKLGFLFQINSHSGYSAGINIADIYWPPNNPSRQSADFAERYNAATANEGYFGWYASQHVGTENPAFTRRQYGFGPYRAGLSCNFNYAHHLQGWNDQAGELYRPMMFVYGCGNGCLDTLAWEGFREGLDDIRYATYLKRLAVRHAKSANYEARSAARFALKRLADACLDDMDLTTLRAEMINHILKLRKFEGK